MTTTAIALIAMEGHEVSFPDFLQLKKSDLRSSFCDLKKRERERMPEMDSRKWLIILIFVAELLRD